MLHIEARAEAFCGPAHNQEDPAYDPGDVSACKDYTSARLRTRNLADWTYGRVEVRARMPQGLGMWPAIWMLPTDTVYGAWPHSGEIDIFEAFAPGTHSFDEPNMIHGTLHYGFSWPWNQYSGAGYEPPANIWDEFHTYAVEWEEGEIRWYVDDVHFATNDGNWFSYFWGGQETGYQVSSGGQPFDQPFHIILNLAIGSPWLGYPDGSTPFPQSMEVDYVRVLECSADPVTGRGCATVDPAAQSITGHVAPNDVRESLWLYRDGVETLAFDADGGTVNSGLTPGFWELAGGNVISNPAYVDGDNIIWDIQFNGTGNAFLISDDGLNFGDNLNSRVKNLGEFKFDLRVVDIEPGTQLRIKLDSGWPDLSFHEIDIPPLNEWTEVSVRFYTLEANDGESWRPSVDYTRILNPFVIEPAGGTAHVQLNNIRIVCLQDAGGGCNIRPLEPPVALTEDFDVFVDAVDPLWGFGIGVWDTGGGHVQTDVVAADESERGKVIDVRFTASGQNGLMFVQTQEGYTVDASAFSSGYLVFDIKVLDYGTNTAGLVVKVDCVNPCSSGDIPIGVVGNGSWETVSVPIASMLPALNLGQVNTPFALLPVWGQQEGVHLQLDNIRWSLTAPTP